MFWLTAKCLNGNSGIITPVDNKLRASAGTPTQRGLHALKSDLDITGNVMDLIVVHKDPREPISNYIVATEGNPRLLAGTTHLGNLVPNVKERNAYTSEGKPIKDGRTGIQERCLVNSPRAHFPIREDLKGIIRKIFDQLQVPRRTEKPVKMVRYPQEEGKKKANMQNERIQWLMAGLNHTRPEAQQLAAQEFLNFNQPDGEMLDEQDPLGTLDQVKLSNTQIFY